MVEAYQSDNNSKMFFTHSDRISESRIITGIWSDETKIELVGHNQLHFGKKRPPPNVKIYVRPEKKGVVVATTFFMGMM